MKNDKCSICKNEKGKLKEPIRKTIFCGTCRKTHPITEDGFEYLDCILEYKRTEPIND